MPVHDWTKVDAGSFHDFHCGWIIHLKESLNAGLLPDGYYAMAEQHARDQIPDVLTLRGPALDVSPRPLPGDRGLALADVPPRVSRKLVADPVSDYRAPSNAYRPSCQWSSDRGTGGDYLTGQQGPRFVRRRLC
jgi:hypothetical protein